MHEAKGEDNLEIYKIQSKEPFGIESDRHSSMTKLLVVTVLVSRFIKKLKKENTSNGIIETFEIENAEKNLDNTCPKASLW